MMRIGELARSTGVSAKAIRYYESVGLMPEPPRDTSGYRRYGGGDLARLQFIASAKQLDLTLDEIRDILSASQSQQVSCPHVLALLAAKRDRIAASIRQAQKLHDALDRTIESSRQQLASSSPAECCPVVERGLHERALGAAETGDESMLIGVNRTSLAPSP